MYNTGLKAGKVLRDATGRVLSSNYSENYRTQQIWRVRKDWNTADPVSYTHLTLPTIYSV